MTDGKLPPAVSAPRRGSSLTFCPFFPGFVALLVAAVVLVRASIVTGLVQRFLRSLVCCYVGACAGVGAGEVAGVALRSFTVAPRTWRSGVRASGAGGASVAEVTARSFTAGLLIRGFWSERDPPVRGRASRE